MSYGLIPGGLNYSMTELPYSFCGDANTTSETPGVSANYQKAIATCTNTYFKFEGFVAEYNSTCLGKQNCTLNIHDYIDFTAPYANNASNPCTTNPGRFYFQYSCVIDNDALNVKRE